MTHVRFDLCSASHAFPGCVSATGIVPTCKDSFMISREDNGPAASLGAIKSATLKAARARCAGQGKSVKARSETNTPRSFGQLPKPRFTSPVCRLCC
jgi:hypothetical protein